MRQRPSFELRSVPVVSARPTHCPGEATQTEDVEVGRARIAGGKGGAPESDMGARSVPVLQWEYTEWILECRVETPMAAGDERT
ncbi:MAG: hypothetical protein KF833_00120 [Verrucomicrobiae bacterium]|nr:hypothetical protein [Verrucomicrobiae bacterium]